jgi:hypothetical protein
MGHLDRVRAQVLLRLLQDTYEAISVLVHVPLVFHEFSQRSKLFGLLRLGIGPLQGLKEFLECHSGAPSAHLLLIPQTQVLPQSGLENLLLLDQAFKLSLHLVLLGDRYDI